MLASVPQDGKNGSAFDFAEVFVAVLVLVLIVVSVSVSSRNVHGTLSNSGEEHLWKSDVYGLSMLSWSSAAASIDVDVAFDVAFDVDVDELDAAAAADADDYDDDDNNMFTICFCCSFTGFLFFKLSSIHILCPHVRSPSG